MDDDKLARDRRGEIFQDELTENQSMPRPARRDDAEATKRLDSEVDSQEGDQAMAENRFGLNEDKRQRYDDDDLVDREIRDQTVSPEPAEDTEVERRSGPDVIRDVEPYSARERAQAIYGETDMDPNRDDQVCAHHAEEDEHL